jgi:poly(3-hydroxybutyrate) depolymerase
MKYTFPLLVVFFVLTSLLLSAQNEEDAKGKAWLKAITSNAISKTNTPGKYAKAPNGLALYFSQAGDIRVPYLVSVPKSYNPAKPTYLVVFLHGAILARDSFQYKEASIADEPIFWASEKFQVLAVFPFARADFAWGRSEAANENIMSIINQVEQVYNVDKKKVYIGGISMGGNATYWFVNNKADFFAGFYAFSSMPREGTVEFSHITEKRPLYTMNARDDQTFSCREIELLHEKIKHQVPGWHFAGVENGGHRFIYGSNGKSHMQSLFSDLFSIPVSDH